MAGVALFSFEDLLDAGPQGYITGITDLDIHAGPAGPVLYALSGSGGISAFDLSGGGLHLLDRGIAAGGASPVPGRLEMIALDGGPALVSLGRSGAALPCFDVEGAGTLGPAAQIALPGGGAGLGAVAALESVTLNGTQYAYVSHLGRMRPV